MARDLIYSGKIIEGSGSISIMGSLIRPDHIILLTLLIARGSNRPTRRRLSFFVEKAARCPETSGSIKLGLSLTGETKNQLKMSDDALVSMECVYDPAMHSGSFEMWHQVEE